MTLLLLTFLVSSLEGQGSPQLLGGVGVGLGTPDAHGLESRTGPVGATFLGCHPLHAIDIVVDVGAAAERARPIVRSDAWLYPPTLAEPFQVQEPAGMKFQEEVDEPGSFMLGAIVGGVLAYKLISGKGDGGPPHWVAIGALMGGILSWTIGIG